MAAPPKLERLTLEDFQSASPEIRAVLEKLFFNLSPFVGDVTLALNRKLTLGDNLSCLVKDVTVTLPDDWTAVGTGLQNGWTDFGAGFPPASYRKDATGQVWIRGLITGGTTGTPITVFTLPTSYAPAYHLHFASIQNGTLNGLEIAVDGSVLYAFGAGNTDFSLNCSFQASDRRPSKLATPITVPVDELGVIPTGVTPIRCVEVTDKSTASAPLPAIAWEQSLSSTGSTPQRSIRLTSVTGLAPLRQYRVTLLVWA